MNKYKQDFVQNELLNLVKKIDPTIEKLGYDNAYGDEAVLIVFKSGFTINCNVSGEGLKEIAINVLKRLI